jgi:hypothetical protein
MNRSRAAPSLLSVIERPLLVRTLAVSVTLTAVALGARELVRAAAASLPVTWMEERWRVRRGASPPSRPS